MPEIWFPNLGIQINSFSRVAVSIFGFDIYWYSLIILTGVITGLLVVLREAKRTGQDPDLYFDYFFYAFPAALIGARLYFVVFSWNHYRYDLWKIVNVREGGLAIYGGVLASILTALIFTRRKKINFLEFADTAILGLLIGQAIGRYGNLFNREAFGGYTEGIFAMRYLKEQVPYISKEVLDKVVTVLGTEYIQVHPTFLYESTWNLVLFIFLNFYKKNKKFKGEIFSLYLLGYGLGRMWIEGMRTDQLLLFQTGIPVSQLLSGILVLAAVVFIGYKRKKTEM